MNLEVNQKSRCNQFAGIDGICSKLRVDPKVGLTGNDFAERTEKFGNNYREEPVAKTWFSLFLGALEDDMLKLLIVCACVSITFDMILADPENRSHGKFLCFKQFTNKFIAWIEGTAIALAVFIVASVGSFVDWRKEIQFIKSRKETNAKNVVSFNISFLFSYFIPPSQILTNFSVAYSVTVSLKLFITMIFTLVMLLWLSTE